MIATFLKVLWDNNRESRVKNSCGKLWSLKEYNLGRWTYLFSGIAARSKSLTLNLYLKHPLGNKAQIQPGICWAVLTGKVIRQWNKHKKPLKMSWISCSWLSLAEIKKSCLRDPGGPTQALGGLLFMDRFFHLEDRFLGFYAN